MDMEAIRVSAVPTARTSSSSPSVEKSGAPQVSADRSEVAGVAADDTVTLSTKGAVESVGAEVSSEKASGANTSSQTRLEVTDKNEVVLKVVDTNTGQVIKEIPAREQQRLSHAIQDTVDKLANNSK